MQGVPRSVRVLLGFSVLFATFVMRATHAQDSQSGAVPDVVRASEQWQVFEGCRKTAQYEVPKFYSWKMLGPTLSALLGSLDTEEMDEMRSSLMEVLNLCKQPSEIRVARIGRQGDIPFLYIEGSVESKPEQTIRLRYEFFEHPRDGLLIDAYEVEFDPPR